MEMELVIALISLFISITAFVYTCRVFYLSFGHKVFVSYSIRSSIYVEDKYVSNLIIENRKNRPLVIHEIYLCIGHGCRIVIKQYNRPFIIKSLEAVHVDIEAPECYELNGRRYSVNKVLENKNLKYKIAISTSDKLIYPRGHVMTRRSVCDFLSDKIMISLCPITKEYGKNIIKEYKDKELLEIEKKDVSLLNYLCFRILYSKINRLDMYCSNKKYQYRKQTKTISDLLAKCNIRLFNKIY